MSEIVFVKKNYTFDCIFENQLFLGELDCLSSNLPIDNEIDGIVNVTPENVNYNGIDSPREEIEKYYNNFFNFCENKNRLLIVCHNSVSRSVTFCILWLMKFKDISYEYSLEYIKNKRKSNQYTEPKFAKIFN